MSGLTAQLLSYVLIYKYYAIFVITYLGAIALPLPAGTVLMAAAAFAGQGYFSLFGIIFIGVLGNMAGDSSGYWLVRLYGAGILNKIKLGWLLQPARTKRVEGLLNRHPIFTIYFSRFFTGIAPTVNVVAGLFKLPYLRFLTFECLGEITEVTFFCLIGYYLGTNWQYFSSVASRGGLVLLLGIAATILFWHLLLRKGNSHE